MFAIVETDIEPEKLKQEMSLKTSGGFVSFEGWVRNHNQGREVDGLFYEAYTGLAEKEGQQIIEEALARFEISSAGCRHRVGELPIGGIAVWVGVSADHREAAFQACQYIIDEIKTRVPIWKKERYRDGTSDWVDARLCAFASG